MELSNDTKIGEIRPIIWILFEFFSWCLFGSVFNHWSSEKEYFAVLATETSSDFKQVSPTVQLHLDYDYRGTVSTRKSARVSRRTRSGTESAAWRGKMDNRELKQAFW